MESILTICKRRQGERKCIAKCIKFFGFPFSVERLDARRILVTQFVSVRERQRK